MADKYLKPDVSVNEIIKLLVSGFHNNLHL
jgi:hypothetical protein